MDDDGGPSYWWRDKRIRELHTALGEHDVAERVQDEILDLIGPKDPDLIERLERLVRKLPREAFTNVDDLLERFATAEDRSRTVRRILQGILVGAGPILVATSIGSLFSQPFGWNRYGWLHYLLWALTVVAIPFSVAAFRWDIGEYFNRRDLERIRRERDRR
jgi:hypothetical protein